LLAAALILVLAPSTFAQSSPDYVLGPEDLITVTVLNHPEFSGDILIPLGGKIGVTGIGYVKAQGQTLEQLSEAITEKFKDRLRDPEVTVVLKIPRVQRVYAGGVVQHPGIIDTKPGWRISEILSNAGGLNPDLQPSDVTVSVQRGPNGPIQTVPLLDAMNNVDGKDLAINAEDVVTFNGPQLITVYVTGNVKTPGVFRIRQDQAGLMEALSQAGGLGFPPLPLINTPQVGPSLTNITITHANGDLEHIDIAPFVLHGEHIPLPVLKNGDLVNVPDAQGRIAILGLVKVAGYFPLPEGRTVTLSEALAFAGGHDTHRAMLSHVAIVRMQDGKEVHLIYNLGRFLSKADLTQNPTVLPGDLIYVPETDSIDWSVILQGIYSTTGLGNLFR